MALAAAILTVGLVQLIGEAGAAAKPEAHASKSVAYKQKTFSSPARTRSGASRSAVPGDSCPWAAG